MFSVELLTTSGPYGLQLRAQAWEFFDYFIPVMVVFIIIEALYSYAHDLELYEFNDTITSMSHGVITDLIVQRMFIPSLDLVVQCWIYYHYAILRFKPAWWMHILTFFAIDCCYYWLHRAAHEINIIWATHQVHHSSERYNFSTATRQGIFQQFFAWMAYIPLAFFIHPTVFWFHKQVNTLYQFWIHTQVVGKLWPILEFFLNTPSHHRVHHARNAKYLDKNYGGVLIIWDRMFGTFEAETETVNFGLVHPDTYFDLFRSQFGHYWHIGLSYISYNSIADKLSLLFFGPGWQPGTGRLGDPLPAELDVTVKVGPSPQPSYNPPLSEHLRSYLIWHSLALGAIIFIITPAIEPKSHLDWVLTLYAVLGLYQVSKIFQQGFAAFLPLEALRIVFYLAVDIGCLVHDIVMERSHGIFWSAGFELSRFSYFDHFILLVLFIIHFVSFWFILHYWDDIWLECNDTKASQPPVAPVTIKRLALPLSPSTPRKNAKTPRVSSPRTPNANATNGTANDGNQPPKSARQDTNHRSISSHPPESAKQKVPINSPASPRGPRSISKTMAKKK